VGRLGRLRAAPGRRGARARAAPAARTAAADSAGATGARATRAEGRTLPNTGSEPILLAYAGLTFLLIGVGLRLRTIDPDAY
jgi:LPXTG-motif cell wall-anchored protein